MAESLAQPNFLPNVNLLPFQRELLSTLADPANSELTLLARGLGLRRIITTLLSIYHSPQNLVLLVNASPEEEAGIGEELSVIGCRKPGLRVVGYEMGRKERQILYKQGGLISVTSRILVVDMLQSDVSVDLITGLVVLHAEKVTALALEAFIIRLFREKNTTGFVKAFSDAPEHITSGLYPLKAIMKELQLRRTHIYPRFHESVKESLSRRRADVIELHQPLTEAMADIHHALVQCMTATLAELKRSHSTLDLDDLSVESTYFRAFDSIVRRQLDPVWHKVGPRTKQLVGDLSTLRSLLGYLLTYDPLAFHAYLESVIASNSTTASGGLRANEHKSQWLFTDAANIVFREAKRRCYLNTAPSKPKEVFDVDNDEEWAALDEAEGRVAARPISKRKKKKWLPDGMQPTLEEHPKWSLLAEILQEIEEEVVRMEATNLVGAPGTNTVLIMVSTARTAELLADYLSSVDRRRPKAEWGRRMMERRLRMYLWWKARLSEGKRSHMPRSDRDRNMEREGDDTQEKNKISDALRKKDALRTQRAASRRRVRGGGPSSTDASYSRSAQDQSGSVPIEEGLSAKDREKLGILAGEGEMLGEAGQIADFFSSQKIDLTEMVDDDSDVEAEKPEIKHEEPLAATPFDSTLTHATSASVNVDEELAHALAEGVDWNYGLMQPEQTILIRAYSDDADDSLLAEVQPRFIVMYEPSLEFVRRVECYRSASPGLAVRVYFMMYQYSCEEHKYLAGLRREKEAFERLIKERATMLLTLEDPRSALSSTSNIIKTISTRMAGGSTQISTAPPQVIVDMREFRSTLPSLLHAAKMVVIPATLTVGDYILTPDICVERKSVPDLVQSFTSGRLYTQCELMSVHYKQPILLIEFEEHKAFSLEAVTGEMKSFVKPTGKYPIKKKNDGPSPDGLSTTSVQAKLVLLTLSFPRLRILWSSSPYISADMFRDLKLNNPEPDPTKAIGVGAEEDPNAGEGVNQAAEELLRTLPGITAKNVKYVMGKVGSVRELCEMSLEQVQELLGSEPGKACWEFIHHGDRPR